MIDWEGLLKFTLKYSDGTKASEFKEMSAEDKKWLEQAMQQYTNSEIKRIQSILKQIQNYKTLPEQTLLSDLQQLQELLDSLDKGSTLYKLQGHISLLKIIFYSPFESCKVIALQIYSSANQNDAKVQNESINTGALEMIELLKQQQTKIMQENLLSAISATIRGQNLEAKRIFIRLKGLGLLEQLLQKASEKLRHKIYVLLRDLLYYDDRLHYTHNDLSSFSNTASLKSTKKQNYDLSYDPNKEQRQKNELPQNKQYKGCVHQFMQEKKSIFTDYLQWLKDRIQEEGQSK